MEGMMRKTFIFMVLLAFAPLGVQAASLDDYYLSRFPARQGTPERTALTTTTSSTVDRAERCGTPLYHGLRQDWQKLNSETRKSLAKYLAKPSSSDFPLSFISIQGYFSIHYTASGPNAPPLADGDDNGVPDWVETVAAAFDDVYQYETGTLGYKPAPTTSGTPCDVYLQNLAPAEFGHTNADPPVTPGGTPGSNAVTSYIVIDNNFTDPVYGPLEPLAALQITAAHEYHHAIQYGYNYYFDIWYAEATSAWIEDEVYDDVNQLYDYLPKYLQNSKLSLDIPVDTNTGGGYGRWIFNRYLAERYDAAIVRSIWERLATLGSTGADLPMLPVIDAVLTNQGSGLSNDFFLFTQKLYKRGWTTHVAEISQIPEIVPAATYLNYPVRSSTSPSPSVTLAHDTFAYFIFTPSATAPQDLVLTLAKSTGITAAAFKKTTGGVITSYQLDASAGTITIAGFNAADTAEAALLITNNTNLDGQTANFTTDISSPPPSAGDGGGGGDGCFIATAAYGSYLHPKVIILRNFRDHYLLTNAPGRALVALYYRASPPLAAFIGRHEMFRTLSRTLLYPLVLAVEYLKLTSLLLLAGFFIVTGMLLTRCRRHYSQQR